MKEDLVGKKFGRLTVIECHQNGREISWLCRCDCGTEGSWKRKALVSGNTQSCGCKHKEQLSRFGELNKSHGLSNTKFYVVYYGMVNRCTYPTNTHYYLYGARGIKVEWAIFEDFQRDMYESYLEHCKKYGQRNTQIDRINIDGNYSKENCRWVTLIEQASNTSRSHFLEYMGRRQTVSAWCRELGISREMVKDRLSRGWSDQDALSIPPLGYKKIYHQGKHNKTYVH